MKERWIYGGIFLCAAIILIFGCAPVRDVFQVFSNSSPSPTLVIDAGHGGFDGGAVGANGVCEQDINLSIAQAVYDLSYFFGYPAKMTRTDANALDYDPNKSISENKIADIHARENFVNEVSDPIFMSIHLNKFEQSKYYGAQVFYSKNNSSSEALAESLQHSLITGIDNKNIRTAKPAANSIYLMKKLNCPAVIVECGFLSNPEEEMLLNTADYQKQLAICIYNGYLNYRNGEINETENTLSLQ